MAQFGGTYTSGPDTQGMIASDIRIARGADVERGGANNRILSDMQSPS
jgi:hypothetical protein